jgi:hypothetical protein
MLYRLIFIDEWRRFDVQFVSASWKNKFALMELRPEPYNNE